MSNQPYPPYPGAAQVPPPAYPTMQQEQAPYPTGYPTSYPATTMDGYPPTTKVDTFTSTAPPPYPTYVHPQQPEKQPYTSTTTENVVIVTQQPGAITRQQICRTSAADHYLTLSILLTVLCVLTCNYCWLFLTIPAIMLASKAKEANASGDTVKAAIYGRMSLRLNISAIVSWIVLWVVVVSAASSVSTGGSSGRSYYTYYTYYYNYYTYYYYYYY